MLVLVFGPERIIIGHGHRGRDPRAPPAPGAHGALEVVLGPRHLSTPHTSALMRQHSREREREERVAGGRAWASGRCKGECKC